MGDLARAGRALRGMLAARLPPDAICLNAVLHSAARAGDVDEVYDVYVYVCIDTHIIMIIVDIYIYILHTYIHAYIHDMYIYIYNMCVYIYICIRHIVYM